MEPIEITVDDKELLETGIESIEDDLRAAFARLGRDVEISEHFTDDVQEVTIGAETGILADWSDDDFDMDCDLPRVGGGVWPCRTHLSVMMGLLRTALGEPEDGATWQLSNIDEDFTFFLATRDQIETAARSADTRVIYDFD